MPAYETMKRRIETTMVATTLCLEDQITIHAYIAGEITSDQMTELLAISSRRKVELILGRRAVSNFRFFGR